MGIDRRSHYPHRIALGSNAIGGGGLRKQTASLIARLRGTEMTKTKDKTPHLKETKDKELKGKNNLVGRVKKVIKKSRRKLGEEKFEKELQRTIEFLAQ